MYRCLIALFAGTFVLHFAGCRLEDRPPAVDSPPAAEAPGQTSAADPPVPAPPPEHLIEVTNPTDAVVTIIAIVDGAEQEIGRVGPNRAARLPVVTQRRTTVRLIARDAYGRTIATGVVEIDGEPARWVIGD